MTDFWDAPPKSTPGRSEPTGAVPAIPLSAFAPPRACGNQPHITVPPAPAFAVGYVPPRAAPFITGASLLDSPAAPPGATDFWGAQPQRPLFSSGTKTASTPRSGGSSMFPADQGGSTVRPLPLVSSSASMQTETASSSQNLRLAGVGRALSTSPQAPGMPAPRAFTPPTRARPRAKDPPPTKILEFLYLGCIGDAHNEQFLRENNISVIINLSQQRYWLADPAIRVLYLSISDVATAPIAELFPRVIRTLERAKRRYYAVSTRADQPETRRNLRRGSIPNENTGHVRKLSALSDHEAPARPQRGTSSDSSNTPTGQKTSQAKLPATPRTTEALGPDSAAAACASLASQDSTPSEDSRRATQLGSSSLPTSQRSAPGSPGTTTLKEDRSHEGGQSSASSSHPPPPFVESSKAPDAADERPSSPRPPCVLVHCLKGVSRSPSAVAAFLIKANGWTDEEAVQYLRHRRSIVEPNMGFQAALKSISDEEQSNPAARMTKRTALCLVLLNVRVDATDDEVSAVVQSVGDVWQVKRKDTTCAVFFAATPQVRPAMHKLRDTYPTGGNITTPHGAPFRFGKPPSDRKASTGRQQAGGGGGGGTGAAALPSGDAPTATQ